MAEVVNLFLMDGETTGAVRCKIGVWEGVIYKIPRAKIESFNGYAELQKGGVYFLFGTSNKTGEEMIYVGKSDNVLKRLIQHKIKPEENYWTEAVVCVKDSSKDSYGPTEISFLEHKFYKLARAANRCKVKNENTPPPGHFTAEIEAMLNVVIRHVRVALKLFGYYHLEPKISTEDLADDSTTFILKRSLKNLGKEITAKGKPTAEGFVVLKGSQISPEADATIPQIVKNERQNAKVDENNILLEDIILPSPSCAAMVVVGKSANGLTSWKTDKNVTLKDFESQS